MDVSDERGSEMYYSKLTYWRIILAYILHSWSSLSGATDHTQHYYFVLQRTTSPSCKRLCDIIIIIIHRSSNSFVSCLLVLLLVTTRRRRIIICTKTQTVALHDEWHVPNTKHLATRDNTGAHYNTTREAPGRRGGGGESDDANVTTQTLLLLLLLWLSSPTTMIRRLQTE